MAAKYSVFLLLLWVCVTEAHVLACVSGFYCLCFYSVSANSMRDIYGPVQREMLKDIFCLRQQHCRVEEERWDIRGWERGRRREQCQ